MSEINHGHWDVLLLYSTMAGTQYSLVTGSGDTQTHTHTHTHCCCTVHHCSCYTVSQATLLLLLAPPTPLSVVFLLLLFFSFFKIVFELLELCELGAAQFMTVSAMSDRSHDNAQATAT